jgi:hypothetical protein
MTADGGLAGVAGEVPVDAEVDDAHHRLGPRFTRRQVLFIGSSKNDGVLH